MVNPILIPSRTKSSIKRGCLVLLCGVLGSLLLETQAANQPGFATHPATSPPNATTVNKPQGKLVLVPPGTVVGTKAPPGWSHLVLKSLPHIDPRHKSRVSQSNYELSSLIFTTILAKVHSLPGTNPPQFSLGDVGLGLGAKVQGHHMVLSPETQARLQANLGLQEKIVLSACYKKQALARAIIRTDTMAVFDTHAVMVRQGQHLVSKMRFAILLNPRNGDIATLAWGMDLDQSGRPFSANTQVEWLAPNTVDDCLLNVDPGQITLGIPNDRAFAVDRAPQGTTRFPLTQELARFISRPMYTSETAAQLESALRTELARTLQKTAQRETQSRVAGGSSPR